MTASTFLAVLRSARYKKGWEISGSADVATGIVYVDADVVRAKHGGRFGVRWMSAWVPLHRLTVKKLERLVLDTIAEAEDHERRERLRFGDRRPFNPHGDA